MKTITASSQSASESQANWGDLKGAVSTEAEKYNQKRKFDDGVKNRIADLVGQKLEKSLNLGQIDAAFAVEIEHKISDAVEAVLRTLREPTDEAHAIAEKLTDEVNKTLSELLPNAKTQLVRGCQWNDQKKAFEITFNKIAPAPNAKCLAIGGAGGKGAVYPSALIELWKAGLLEDVDVITGASAGSLNAVILASGADPHEMKEFVDHNTPDQLVNTDDQQEFSRLYPMYTAKKSSMLNMLIHGLGRLASKPLSRTGGNLIKRFDKQTSMQVHRYLNAHFQTDAALEAAAREKGINAESISRLKDLRNHDPENDFKNQCDRTGRMITFGDLDILHDLDSKTFKKLAIPVCDYKNHKTYFLNAEMTPDLPICLAARVSSGLPLIFEPVKLQLSKYYKTFFAMDGGFGGHNSPSELYLRKTEEDTENPRTEEEFASIMALNAAHEERGEKELQRNDTTLSLMHNPLPNFMNPSTFLGKLRHGMQKSTGFWLSADARNKDAEVVQNYFGYVAYHDKKKVTSFWDSKEQTAVANHNAVTEIKQQILQRQNQAYFVTAGTYTIGGEALEALHPLIDASEDKDLAIRTMMELADQLSTQDSMDDGDVSRLLDGEISKLDDGIRVYLEYVPQTAQDGSMNGTQKESAKTLKDMTIKADLLKAILASEDARTSMSTLASSLKHQQHEVVSRTIETMSQQEKNQILFEKMPPSSNPLDRAIYEALVAERQLSAPPSSETAEMPATKFMFNKNRYFLDVLIAANIKGESNRNRSDSL